MQFYICNHSWRGGQSIHASTRACCPSMEGEVDTLAINGISAERDEIALYIYVLCLEIYQVELGVVVCEGSTINRSYVYAVSYALMPTLTASHACSTSSHEHSLIK